MRVILGITTNANVLQGPNESDCCEGGILVRIVFVNTSDSDLLLR